ncbi:hypothetical protein AALA17_04275 [Lactobacillaceae bacterium 24-114]
MKVLSIIVTIIGLFFPVAVKFMRSHYLNAKLLNVEIPFLGLEKRFQLDTALIATPIISNFLALFVVIIESKLSVTKALNLIILDLILLSIVTAIFAIYDTKHLKGIYVKIDKIEYKLLHRLDEKYISAHPVLDKDNSSIILLSIDELTNHKIYLK